MRLTPKAGPSSCTLLGTGYRCSEIRPCDSAHQLYRFQAGRCDWTFSAHCAGVLDQVLPRRPIQGSATSSSHYIAMPFLDLNHRTRRELFRGFKGHFVHSATMTFVHWDIEPGALLPEHSHPHEQVVNMIEGEFELTINGQTQRLLPGHVAIIPAHALHSGKAITRCLILDAFCPIREDYRDLAVE